MNLSMFTGCKSGHLFPPSPPREGRLAVATNNIHFSVKSSVRLNAIIFTVKSHNEVDSYSACARIFSTRFRQTADDEMRDRLTRTAERGEQA